MTLRKFITVLFRTDAHPSIVGSRPVSTAAYKRYRNYQGNIFKVIITTVIAIILSPLLLNSASVEQLQFKSEDHSTILNSIIKNILATDPQVRSLSFQLVSYKGEMFWGIGIYNDDLKIVENVDGVLNVDVDGRTIPVFVVGQNHTIPEIICVGPIENGHLIAHNFNAQGNIELPNEVDKENRYIPEPTGYWFGVIPKRGCYYETLSFVCGNVRAINTHRFDEIIYE